MNENELICVQIAKIKLTPEYSQSVICFSVISLHSNISVCYSKKIRIQLCNYNFSYNTSAIATTYQFTHKHSFYYKLN